MNSIAWSRLSSDPLVPSSMPPISIENGWLHQKQLNPRFTWKQWTQNEQGTLCPEIHRETDPEMLRVRTWLLNQGMEDEDLPVLRSKYIEEEAKDRWFRESNVILSWSHQK